MDIENIDAENNQKIIDFETEVLQKLRDLLEPNKEDGTVFYH